MVNPFPSLDRTHGKKQQETYIDKKRFRSTQPNNDHDKMASDDALMERFKRNFRGGRR